MEQRDNVLLKKKWNKDKVNGFQEGVSSRSRDLERKAMKRHQPAYVALSLRYACP
jgi:hypothetical protein